MAGALDERAAIGEGLGERRKKGRLRQAQPQPVERVVPKPVNWLGLSLSKSSLP
jgi:hypothetical protein